MDFDWTTLTENLGWRELLIFAIGLLAVYVFVVFLRLLLLRPKVHEEVVHSDVFDDEFSASELIDDAAPAVAQAAPVGEAPKRDLATKRFVEHRHLEVVEHDVADIQEEMKNLRSELRLLRNDLQQQVDRLKVSQNTSPLYSDAMQMALLGHDANTIAERCSIAVAEAELVVALANSRVE
jgi:hypothetical protein